MMYDCTYMWCPHRIEPNRLIGFIIIIILYEKFLRAIIEECLQLIGLASGAIIDTENDEFLLWHLGTEKFSAELGISDFMLNSYAIVKISTSIWLLRRNIVLRKRQILYEKSLSATKRRSLKWKITSLVARAVWALYIEFLGAFRLLEAVL